MSERIAYLDIQAGDTVEARRTVKVGAIDGSRNRRDEAGVVIRSTGFEFYLIERPLPPLPTEIGSVIETGHVRWFLREDFDAEPRWVATGYGTNNTPDELLRIVKANGGFEVLL